MKKLLILPILTVLFLAPFSDTYSQRREGHRGKGRKKVVKIVPQYRNYTYTVVKEKRYVRVWGRVYREVYRSTYDPYGRLVRRVFLYRERVRKYERYDRYRDDRRSGIQFNIFLRF